MLEIKAWNQTVPHAAAQRGALSGPSIENLFPARELQPELCKKIPEYLSGDGWKLNPQQQLATCLNLLQKTEEESCGLTTPAPEEMSLLTRDYVESLRFCFLLSQRRQ